MQKTVQVVIEIDEDIYENRDDEDYIKMCAEEISTAFRNGTVLKPHGRCIDADAIIKDLNTLKDAFVINFDKTTGKFMGIACTAPTILEAWGNEE